MASYYESKDRMIVAVDCIILGIREGRLAVLLTNRGFEPMKGVASVMGGFVTNDESVDNAAKRVLRELTGIDNVFMRQVGAFGAVDRDPGARVVSVAYCALLDADKVPAQLLQEHNARWVTLPADSRIDDAMAEGTFPWLYFDHPLMISRALHTLRRWTVTEPVIFELLPPRWTLTTLQNISELILGEPLDKRNFRKRILENPCIIPTDEIDKTGSRRGARMYRFDRDTYLRSQSFKL